MIDEILIERGLMETRVALIAEGWVQEVLIEAERRRSPVGDIYLGRVARVVPGVQAAFVELGLARGGFLPAREARFAPAARGAEGGRPPRIGECVSEGEVLLVQVSRGEREGKGVRLTTNLTLAGRRLVYTPRQSGVAVSRRISDEDERARLEGAVAELAEVEGGGFVVRTAAEGAGEEALAAEVDELEARWRQIEAGRAGAEVPACLHQEPGLLTRALRDHVEPGVRRVLVDSADTLAEARRACAGSLPGVAERLELHRGPEALFDLYDADAEIEAALEPRVPLPSGGSLAIESTEALVAVDVNSGSFADARGQRDVVLWSNLEAADEAARQIRLRGLGGLIVIDFIQMRSADDGAEVMAALKEALSGDRAPVRVSGLTPFGLAEITRKRVVEPLARLLTEPCECCRWGRMKTAEAVAAEVLRHAEREAAAAPGRGLTLTAAPEVADVLEEDDGALVAALEGRVGASVRLEADGGYGRTRYEIAHA